MRLIVYNYATHKHAGVRPSWPGDRGFDRLPKWKDWAHLLPGHYTRSLRVVHGELSSREMQPHGNRAKRDPSAWSFGRQLDDSRLKAVDYVMVICLKKMD